MVSEIGLYCGLIIIGLCLNPCSCGRWSQSFSLEFLLHKFYSLNPCSCGRWSQSMATSTLFGKEIVLILVLVEDGLRAVRRCMYDKVTGESLNPCSCGRWSQRLYFATQRFLLKGLNPCSCGRWSQRIRRIQHANHFYVLILVLVEDGLREESHGSKTTNG